MQVTFIESLRNCIALIDDLIVLIEEDESDTSACFQGLPLSDYREITKLERRALENVKADLKRGC